MDCARVARAGSQLSLRCLKAVLLGVFAILPTLRAQELVPAADRRAIGSFAVQLAKVKDPAAEALLPKLIAELGASETELAKLRERIAKASARAKAPKRVSSSLGKTASRLAKRLAAKLGKLEGPAKQRLARVVVQLDGRVVAAQKALGRKLVDGEWSDATKRATTERRLAILEKIAEARSLELELVVTPSKHEMVTKTGCKEAWRVQYGQLAFHCGVPKEIAVEIVDSALRAAALGEWLVSGKLAPAFAELSRTWVLVPNKKTYEVCVDIALATGMDPQFGQYAKTWSSFYHQKRDIKVFTVDDDCERSLTGDLVSYRRIQKFLLAGLTEFVTRAVIGANTAIGRFCIVNSQASLDHDCRLDDFASLAPGSVIGGGVAIGERSVVGIGAVVRHDITIGHDVVIGANSYVHTDCGDEAVYFGTPAKAVRKRHRNEPYL